MLASVDINWAAVLVAGVVNMVLGAIWYAPGVFGKMWAEEMGKKDMKMQPGPMVGMFILALAIAYIMTHFVVYAGADTFSLGIEVGIWASLGFNILTRASATFASAGSWRLWAINSGFWLVSFALMGGILASMR